MRQSASASKVLLLVLLAGAGSHAQSQPDFSGVWTLAEPADSAGQTLAISQTATTLTLRYLSKTGAESATYNLDGTETRRTVPHLMDRTSQIVAKARWQARALVIEETQLVDGRPSRSKRVLSIDGSGRLVVADETPLVGYADTPADFPERRRRLVFVRQ